MSRAGDQSGSGRPDEGSGTEHGRPARSRAVVGAIALGVLALLIYAGYIVAVVLRGQG